MTLFKDLHQIGLDCGTDKATMHGYTRYYNELLATWRHKPLTLVEIGVDGGESIKMWSQYFTSPDTTIYGVDIHDKKGDLGRGKFVLGDATQPNFIHDLVTLTGPIDIVVDDGSHFSGQQKDSLRLLWPHLKSSGMYIVEDCHSSYHYPWTIPEEVSFVHSMVDWIDALMEKGSGHCGVPTESAIDEIVFRKSLVIIKKR